MMDVQRLIEQAKRARSGAIEAYGDGREDHRIGFKRASDDKGVDVDAEPQFPFEIYMISQSLYFDRYWDTSVLT